MSVISGESSSRRSRNNQRWYSSTLGASSATNAFPSRFRQRGRDAFDGDRDERRLRDARGRDVARRAGAGLRTPHPSTADVTRAVGEDHVREHPVRPLTAEQRAQLVGRA